MKKLIYSIIFVLSVFLVNALEVTQDLDVVVGETVNFAGRTFTILNIGSEGSTLIRFVNSEKTYLIRPYGEPQTVKSIKFEILSFSTDPGLGGNVKLRLTTELQDKCSSDSDCNDNNTCTTDTCTGEPKVCKNEGNLCNLDNNCYELGTILNISGIQNYCFDNNWLKLKEPGRSCENNFECVNGNCVNNICSGYIVGSKKPGFLEEITGLAIFKTEGGDDEVNLLVFIVGIIIAIKGLFILVFPKQSRAIIARFLRTNNSVLRLFGLIAFIIGIVFVLLYLA